MMKSLKKVFALAILLMSIINFYPQRVEASDAGYYYKNMDIQVEVNEEREFIITETLDVFYEESMHGIVRNIPNESSVEGYMIKNVSVSGANYVVEDTYNGIDIRIGDSDTLVSGDKQYVINYTLAHYQDYDDSADYIYMNLVGNDFDTRIENLTASITYPENAIFEKCTITEGEYGSLINEKISSRQDKNTFYFKSNSQIEEYEAVSVQIQLAQGAFPNAPVYVFPYLVKEKIVNITIDSQQDFHVQQHIVLESNQTYTYYPLDVNLDIYDFKVEEKDFSGTYDGRQIDSDYHYSVSFDSLGEHTIDYSYILHPRKIQEGDVEFVFEDGYQETKIENLKINITLPQLGNYGITYNRRGDSLNRDRFDVVESTSSLTLTSKSPLQASEKAAIFVNLNKEDFSRPIPFIIQLAPFVSGALFLVALFLKFWKYRNQPIICPVTFYPPKGINSAEAGFLIDGRLSDEDITSLIFSWAHQGALRIEQVGKRFTLVKTDELPVSTPAYEKRMFKNMFYHGEDGRVDKSDLKGSFYIDVDAARSAILKKYKTDQPIIEKGSQIAKRAISIIAIILFLVNLIVFQATFDDSIFDTLVPLLFTLFPMFIVTIIIYIVLAVKHTFSFNTVSTQIILFMMIPLITVSTPLIFFLDFEIYGPQFWMSSLFCVLSLLVGLTIKKKTEFMNKIYGELKGFKDFIKHAEKDKLEMLIEEDPEYYYGILPYAQALHVTKIWQNKFEDIAMQPPTYYISNTDIFVYSSFNRAVKNVSSGLRSSAAHPVSSGSSGSGGGSSGGYSGGGGGFSSGGSSGGGSGGGGSHGW